MNKLKPCPFCGGRAKVMARQTGFAGQNCLGNKKIQWRVYIACNKCRSRGKPITTEYIKLNDDDRKLCDVGNFYASEFWGGKGNMYATHTFLPYVSKAIEAWNRRVSE